METNSQQDCVNVCQPVGMLALQLANIATTLPPIRLSIKIKKSQICTKLQRKNYKSISNNSKAVSIKNNFFNFKKFWKWKNRAKITS